MKIFVSTALILAALSSAFCQKYRQDVVFGVASYQYYFNIRQKYIDTLKGTL